VHGFSAAQLRAHEDLAAAQEAAAKHAAALLPPAHLWRLRVQHVREQAELAQAHRDCNAARASAAQRSAAARACEAESCDDAAAHLFPPSSGPDEVFDTVGAVCVDARGHVAAGVSSGGIAMKLDGRVGDSAVFGCGVWAADPAPGVPGTAITTTGVGENIIRTLLARSCCDAMRGGAGEAPMDLVRSRAGVTGIGVEDGGVGSGGVRTEQRGLTRPERERMWLRDLCGLCSCPHRVVTLALRPVTPFPSQAISRRIQEGVRACPPPHDVGVLALQVDASAGGVAVQMAVVHTAASMGVAWQGSDGATATEGLKILRQINR